MSPLANIQVAGYTRAGSLFLNAYSNWSTATEQYTASPLLDDDYIHDAVFDDDVFKAGREAESLPANNTAIDDQEFCAMFQFVLNTVVIGLLCILGFTGNTVSILVLQKDRHNRVAVFLLQALAVADNSVLFLSFFVLSIVYGMLPMLGYAAVSESLIPPIAQWVNPLGTSAQCCVIWITVLLAVNRYVAICRPFTSKKWLTMKSTRIQVAVVVLVSLALNAPRFYYDACNNQSASSSDSNSSLLFSDWPTNSMYNVSTENPIIGNFNASKYSTDGAIGNSSNANCPKPRSQFQMIYINYIYTSVALILPLVLTVGFNIPLIKQIQRSKHRMIENSLSYRGRQENNITMVMVVVVIVMTICHTPDRVVMIIRFFSGPLKCPSGLFYAINIANLFVMTNSSIDFVIYYIFRRRFRTILRNKLCCCVDKEGVSYERERGSLPSQAGAESMRHFVGSAVRDGSARRSLPPGVGNIFYAPLVALRNRTSIFRSLRKEKRTSKVAAVSNGFGSHKGHNGDVHDIIEEERNGLTVL